MYHQHIYLNAGKWVATDAVAKQKQDRIFKKIMCSHQSQKAGSGAFIPEIQSKSSHAYQKFLSLVQEEPEVEKSFARAVQLKLQGQWTK